MNILTDQEIHNADTAPHLMFDQQRIDFARAIESAVIAKLSAGANVEPFWIRHEDICGNSVGPDTPYYSVKDFKTSIAAARVQAIEEAAKVCLEVGNNFSGHSSKRPWSGHFAEAIRALITEAA